MLVLAGVTAASVTYGAVPQRISYQGQYTVNGVLANGAFPFAWRLYATESGGSALWSDADTLAVTSGVFHAYLGSNTPLPPAAFTGQTLWLETDVDGTSIPGRVPLVSVAYSFKSAYADTAQFAHNGGSASLWSTDGSNVWRPTGKVGIGTSSPSEILHLERGPGGGVPSVLLRSYVPGTGSFGRLQFQNVLVPEQGIAAEIEAVRPVATWGQLSDMIFRTSPGGPSPSLTERVRITSGGFVGIGTDLPVVRLDVAGTMQSTGFKMPTGASPGYVLTSDASGVGSWQPGGGGGLGGSGTTNYLAKFTGPTTLGSSSNMFESGGTMTINGSVGAGGNLLNVANGSNGRSIYASTNATQNVYAAIYGDALADGGVGVFGHTNSLGVSGGSSIGVFGYGENTGASVGGATLGVFGRVRSYQTPGNSVPVGVFGEATSTAGVAWGVAGETFSTASGAAGVKGTLKSNGVTGRAIWGDARPASNPSAYAGWFDGNVHIVGTLSKTAGSFKIDHPLDPENKYLSHSFVESPDMMNVYNGNIVLDSKGEATVTLPNWFEALNKEFRYQLTSIGGPGPSLYISREVKGNSFSIAGGTSGLKVSWQVTGIRHDPYADAHRIQVEEEKSAHEKGKLLHPTEYGYPENQRIE